MRKAKARMNDPKKPRWRRRTLLQKNILERIQLQYEVSEFQRASKVFRVADRLARRRKTSYIV